MIRKLLPRVRIFEAWSCDPTDAVDPGTEGHALVISWLGVVIEITVSRVTR